MIIIYFLIVVILIISLIFQIKYFSNIENFMIRDPIKMKSNGTIFIKKTNNYKLVYKSKNYCIWEPENIDEYLPTGQYVTKNANPPEKLAILVKSEYKNNDRPSDFQIIGTTNNIFIWKIIPKKGYSSLGHIFSKNKPSIHRFRCVPNNLLIEDNLKNIVAKEKYKNLNICIWEGYESDQFLCSGLSNKNTPIDTLFKYKMNCLKISEKLDIIYTKSYDKICDLLSVSIWRPKNKENYYSIGLIAYPKNKDPNNLLNSMLVNKKHCKPLLNYGNKLYTFVSGGKSFTIWSGKTYKTYGIMSNIIAEGIEEPDIDNIIYSISLDYLNNKNYDRRMLWNNLPNDNIKSLWVDKYYNFHFSNSMNKPYNNELIINEDLINFKLDRFDEPKDFILLYRLNKNNIDNYNEDQRKELLVKSLSKKLDIKKSRLINISFDEDNKKIYLTLNSRKNNTNESNTNEILKLLKTIIDNTTVKIYNSEKTNFISEIIDIEIKNSFSNKIKLDNSVFKNEFINIKSDYKKK